MDFFVFDAEYLRRLKAGDPAVVAHFVGYFSRILRVKLRARRASLPAITDITQETFLRVFKTLRSQNGIQSPGALGAYVNSVCNYVIQEQNREMTRREPLNDDYAEVAGEEPDAEEALVTGETRAFVRKVLGSLPAKDARLLRAVFVEERSKDDICQELGVSREYLRVLLHRAKEQFRRRYLGEER